jgi:hypothetical protein
MRQLTVICKSRSTASNKAPWASRITKITDGFKCFESIDDYNTWINQK